MHVERMAVWSVILSVLGCAAPRFPSVPRAGLAAGTRLSDLPPGYALVIGRVRVAVDGEPLACSAGQTLSSCGLAVRYQTGEMFFVPHQSHVDSLSVLGDPDPFFAVRLPQGGYEVIRFEAPSGALDHGSLTPRGSAISLRERFSVRAGELLYVGSLYVDVDASGGRRCAVRVVDEAAQAARVAREIESAAPPRLTVRLMEPSPGRADPAGVPAKGFGDRAPCP